MIKRSSGILMHITSLPGSYGIGTFGKEAYEFVDFLQKSGQKNWQILPLGSTGYGDSPYQSFSAFAGNPYFIDLELLLKEGILDEEYYENIDFGRDEERIDFEKVFRLKMAVLKIAYEVGKDKFKEEIGKFKEENKDWLEDYALYMAIKGLFDLKSWQEWPEDIRLRKAEAISYYGKKLEDEMNYWIFLQYLFLKQWKNLKNYANGKGIQIIGDIPIYVAEDSADAWANSKIFLFDEEKKPIKVAGCPPDFFSPTGQLWGNPLYRWDLLEETGFDWWIKRIEESIKLYDILRIDHFRGFESYWAIPHGEKTAVNGSWAKGPGMKLFNAIEASLGTLDIIAEDLGFLTRDAIDFRVETSYPGMKVLQFAFDSSHDSDYLPHKHDKNCVVYTGTHDNDTVYGWFEHSPKKEVDFAIKYLKLTEDEGYNWGFIRGAWSSTANLAMAQLQDFLGLGSMGRMNIPSTMGGNWLWRVKKEDLTDELAAKIYDMTKLYGR